MKYLLLILLAYFANRYYKLKVFMVENSFGLYITNISKLKYFEDLIQLKTTNKLVKIEVVV